MCLCRSWLARQKGRNSTRKRKFRLKRESISMSNAYMEREARAYCRLLCRKQTRRTGQRKGGVETLQIKGCTRKGETDCRVQWSAAPIAGPTAFIAEGCCVSISSRTFPWLIDSSWQHALSDTASAVSQPMAQSKDMKEGRKVDSLMKRERARPRRDSRRKVKGNSRQKKARVATAKGKGRTLLAGGRKVKREKTKTVLACGAMEKWSHYKKESAPTETSHVSTCPGGEGFCIYLEVFFAPVIQL